MQTRSTLVIVALLCACSSPSRRGGGAGGGGAGGAGGGNGAGQADGTPGGGGAEGQGDGEGTDDADEEPPNEGGDEGAGGSEAGAAEGAQGGDEGGQDGVEGGQGGDDGEEGGQEGGDQGAQGGDEGAQGCEEGAQGGDEGAQGGDEGAQGGDEGGEGVVDEPPLTYCLQMCAAARDCASPAAVGAFDADNYACDDGRCLYTGCNSTAECNVSAPQGTRQVCVDRGGAPSCQTACARPADCAIPNPAYDEDNWRCSDGACEYAGCNNDRECQESNPAVSLVCVEYENLDWSYCARDCNRLGDCFDPEQASSAFDGDNFACEEGICTYTGCIDDGECVAAFGDRYACRTYPGLD